MLKSWIHDDYDEMVNRAQEDIDSIEHLRKMV